MNKRPPPSSQRTFGTKLESKLQQTTFIRPKTENDEKQHQINPENIIKALDNGHALVMVLTKQYKKEMKSLKKDLLVYVLQLKRTRVKGFCVECIKKSGDPAYKKTMTKIITYCPQCPVSNFIFNF